MRRATQCRIAGFTVGGAARAGTLTHPGHSIRAVYLYRSAIDFRKSIGGLSALVEQGLGLNPFGDALYLFINRRHDKLKALYWHRNGFCLWYMYLAATGARPHGVVVPLGTEILKADRAVLLLQEDRAVLLSEKDGLEWRYAAGRRGAICCRGRCSACHKS